MSAPTSARELQSVAAKYAKQQGLAVGRVYHSISFTVLAAVLERCRLYDGSPAFTVKGGVAIERRLGNVSRTTKDFDAVFGKDPVELVRALDEAFAEPYQEFSLRRNGEPENIGNALRISVRIDYYGRAWGTIPLEVSRFEGPVVTQDVLPAIDLTVFGLEGPQTISCLPIRRQIAQKIHALTEPPKAGKAENPRFKDLVDLWLLRDKVPLDAELRAECKQIFRRRGTHPWPPTITIYESWVQPFQRTAQEDGLPVGDVRKAAADVQEVIKAIHALSRQAFALEFREILKALEENSDLRDDVFALIGKEPIAGKVTEGGERLPRFREIMERLVQSEIELEEAMGRVEVYLPRGESAHAGNNRVFPIGWAERLVRTQLSRFYNQAVMEQVISRGETHCFVPHSSDEYSESPCSRLLAGRRHEVKQLHDVLVDSYGRGNWRDGPKIPDHPHCTHVVTPVDAESIQVSHEAPVSVQPAS